MGSPPAEIDIGEDLLRSLLGDQHPDLADRPLKELDAGWDNTLWRVGDELLARLPRRAIAAPLALNEQRWLPSLAEHLPLPIPTPIRVGLPSDIYPWPWSVVPWLEGTPGDRSTISDPLSAADTLGRFLKALHQPAPPEAPHNPYRGVALSERRATFEERLESLASEVDTAAVRGVWERGVAAEPRSSPRVWIHGDLHPANTLIQDGRLAAVIDFGDLCAGDPATDLAGAWMLLPGTAMAMFESAYGRIDPALEARSLGWAVLLGLMLLGIGLNDRPTFEPIGRFALARAVDR